MPVRPAEVGVAQSVAERVHGAVDVAQPVSYTESPSSTRSSSLSLPNVKNADFVCHRINSDISPTPFLNFTGGQNYKL